jgi:hypothetical protein
MRLHLSSGMDPALVTENEVGEHNFLILPRDKFPCQTENRLWINQHFRIGLGCERFSRKLGTFEEALHKVVISLGVVDTEQCFEYCGWGMPKVLLSLGVVDAEPLHGDRSPEQL